MSADWTSLATTPFVIVAGKIALAYALALPTGWWREKEGHAVGIRTFPIVAMASCGYLLAIGNAAPADLSRILQGLIAGIGFVGGGAIVKEGLSVHGTAAAASIWNTGAIGAACAFGNYEVAILLSVLNLI